MLIKGLVKTTLLDYPGKVACTVFLAGCNFRCPYCQNPALVEGYEKLPTIEKEGVFKHLVRRKKWLDGVCVSGGEPTLNSDLSGFLGKIKDLGFLVKLDTNGTNPEVLQELLKDKLLDYVAIDIKAPLDKYKEITRSEVDEEKIKRSVDIIRNSRIDYEFRTTVVPTLIGKSDIMKICEWLHGSKSYYLQQFSPSVVLDPSLKKVAPYKKEEMLKFRDIAKDSFGRCEVRGI